MIELHLPWPPSNNKYYRHVAIGKHKVRVLLSREAREFREKVQAYCRDQAALGIKMNGPLALTIKTCPPDNRKRDIDNIPKAVKDAITLAEVWHDDSQVARLVVERGPVVKGGILGVTIAPAQEWAV